jgi:intracellular multiplication protein IcmT
MRGVDVFDGFWRESARGLKLFFLPAWTGVPLLFFLLHITWFTFLLLVATIVAMMIVERFGYTVPVALLAIRAKIAGKVVKRRRCFFNWKLDA